ncbi:hypothetical protein SAMN05216388_1002219 [Halorientalis persicus]|jgi:phosphotransferase system  glucose/maltose/N-acetylglucosamine-specific IIC component|uniref:DUF8142 domain-containing protein n=1 Tax=Halorientalis persicus TaxID=1367881 RepID=A0A1H8F982_9EURY|nr:hypothetical protein [Halorientalis persicus]SEN27974.1 hypothetical protein SAMN05216388_1002219 [Halorientalis persicus]
MDELLSGDEGGVSRKQAALWILPFFALGIADVILLLQWGLDGLWGFMILPPILFICVLAYIAFRTGFATDRTGDVTGEAEQSEASERASGP